MDFDLRFWGPYPPLHQWAAYWITDICRTRVLTNYVLLNILTNSQMSALSLFRSISTYYRFMFNGMFQQNALKFATILEYYTFSCFEFLPNQILLPFSKNHQLFRLSTSSFPWKIMMQNFGFGKNMWPVFAMEWSLFLKYFEERIRKPKIH